LTKARRAGGRKLRVSVRIAAKELRRLPWELMVRDRRLLFSDPENPISREWPAPAEASVADEALPLRILVVIGVRDDDEKVKWKEELEVLRRSLHDNDMVELEELICPDAQEVIDALRDVQPHVLHFIGHGRMNAATKEAELVFYGAGTRAWPVNRIIQDLTLAGWTPPLVFLNACRSGDLDADQSAYELAQVFIEQGARCVIGMQGDIDGGAAAVFAESVYQAIVKGRPLDSAVAGGRAAIALQRGETRDWALPVMYLASAAPEALPREFGIPNAVQLLNDFREKFKELDDFVDRRDERRGLCSTLLGRGQSLQPQNLIVVVGPDAIGKSGVVGWCARHLRLRGRQVHYRNLARKEGVEIRSVLKSIRDGIADAHCAVLGPLPAEPFQAFDRKLKALEANEPEADDPIPQLVETFIAGLALLAEKSSEPVVIVLDQFELTVPGAGGTVDTEDFRVHLKPFFDSVAAGMAGNLKLVVVIRERELNKEASAAALKNKGKDVRIGTWPGAEFELLARLFAIGAMKIYRQDLIEKTLGDFSDIRNRNWSPADLLDFGDMLKIRERQAERSNR
ncbi:MAG TPA: CHAT domain-containing protein, partial [Thermoanaerobaculia bacterium]